MVGIVGDDYYLGNRFEKIEEKLGKVMTKEEGERIEKTLGMLKTDVEKILTDQDELKACVGLGIEAGNGLCRSEEVRISSMTIYRLGYRSWLWTTSRRRDEGLICYGSMVFALYYFKTCYPTA